MAQLPLIKDDGTWYEEYAPQVQNVRPTLSYIEYQVADECNLKCCGCMHFSNLVKTANHPDISDFITSLKHLSERFQSIKMIRLMGGEPLLNSKLDLFVRVAREFFPLAEIRIVTNGLLIPKSDDALVDAMKDTQTSFDISQYPPTRKIASDIVKFCDNKQIRYEIGNPITHFLKRASFGERDFHRVFKESCLSNACTFLRNDTLYVCPHIPMLYEAKEHFNIDITPSEMFNNGMNLSDKNLNGWDIVKRLQEPFSLCRFCSLTTGEIEWKIGKAKIEDWFIA